jgi:sugar phosphate isomerase/epimerase
MAFEVLEKSMSFAAKTQADYVVFHARGRLASLPDRAVYLAKWRVVVERLAAAAGRLGLTFCLENADDLTDLAEIEGVICGLPGNVGLCLDIGHLYERSYEGKGILKKALIINDRLSPRPFLWKAGLPVSPKSDWAEMCECLLSRITCLHLHNHDGRRAHTSLRSGKIDLRPLREIKMALKDIPVIVEVDYRAADFQFVLSELKYLYELAT